MRLYSIDTCVIIQVKFFMIDHVRSIFPTLYISLSSVGIDINASAEGCKLEHA